MRKVKFMLRAVRRRVERFAARRILGIDWAINHGWMPVEEADRKNAEFLDAYWDDEDTPYLELVRDE